MSKDKKEVKPADNVKSIKEHKNKEAQEKEKPEEEKPKELRIMLSMRVSLLGVEEKMFRFFVLNKGDGYERVQAEGGRTVVIYDDEYDYVQQEGSISIFERGTHDIMTLFVWSKPKDIDFNLAALRRDLRCRYDKFCLEGAKVNAVIDGVNKYFNKPKAEEAPEGTDT